MDSASNPLDFRLLPIAQLRPNPWNPNRIPAELLQKLRAAIAERGLLGTLLVRPREDHFEVVDGEHRLRIARELQLAEAPCLVVPLSDTEAKIKTLQLNGLRGENDPELLARLLLDLSLELDVAKLAEELPYDRLEIESSLELLALPDRDLEPKALAERMEEENRREIFAAVVTAEERAMIEGAIRQWRSRQGDCLPGAALARICQAFLDRREP